MLPAKKKSSKKLQSKKSKSGEEENRKRWNKILEKKRKAEASTSKKSDPEVIPVKFEDVPVEWKHPHSLSDLALKCMTMPVNKIVTVGGLEKSEWHVIFNYLHYDTVKACRLVCKGMNNFVTTCPNFAQRSVIIFTGELASDEGFGKLSSLINDPKIIPYWTQLRLESVGHSHGRLWLGRILADSLRTLELKNCSLNWFDFMEILGSFSSLDSLSIVLNKNARGGPMKYFSLFMYGVDIGEDFEMLLDKSLKFPFCDLNTFSASMANLRSLHLDVMYIEMTNMFIQFFGLAHCSKIEDLTITLSKDVFMDVPPEVKGKIENHPTLFTSPEFLQNNKESLRKLYVTFADDVPERRKAKLCEGSEMFTNCVLHLGALRRIFDPETSIKNLYEFGLDLATFSIHGEKMKPVLRTNFLNLQGFIQAQRNLRKLSLRDWCWGDENAEMEASIPKALVPSSCQGNIGLFILGGFNQPSCPKWTDNQDILTSIKIQWETCNIRRLNEIIPEETVQMPRVENFELLNNLPICFVNFDVEIIVSKLPNLTRLHLEDTQHELGTLCPQGHRIEPAKFHDSDLQLIFGNLVKLEVLYIKTRMYLVTDFAFTGLSPESFLEMDTIYDHNENALTGFRLSNLKKLKSLTLIGLSYKVTDMTAFNAFNDPFPALRTLNFVTSGISKEGRQFIRDRFGSRKSFNLTINPGQPRRMTFNCSRSQNF